MPSSLHPLLKLPERWLPKFNRGDDLPAEKHLHNYMLAINLNEIYEEDIVVRLFPYTLIGLTGSWYFSLLANSITSWDIFERTFFPILQIERRMRVTVQRMTTSTNT